MTETYAGWRTPDMWQMVADEGGQNVQAHLMTLRRQQVAIEAQRDRLRSLRDQLVEGWPPEKSEASLAFIQRVNDMISVMSVTALGAAEIRSNLDHIAQALATARTEMAPLVAQYNASAKFVDPFVQRRLEQVLDNDARTILMTADRAVAEPAQALDVPLPLYERFKLTSEVVAVGDGEPNGGSTGDGRAGSRIRNGPKGVSQVAAPVFEPPVPSAAAHDDSFSLASGVDRIGAAGAPQLPQEPATPGPGPVANPYVGGVIGRQPALLPIRNSGVIGRRTSQAQSVPLRRVERAASGPQTHGAPAIGGPGAGRSGTRSAETPRRGPRGVPDRPWSVEEGVPAVLEAPKVARHDPGPGVLGIDL